MFGDKGNGRYDERNPVAPGATDLVVGCRADPFQRADTALITDPPIEPRPIERGDHCSGGRFHLVRIGVSRPHDPFRQSMRGEQNTRWSSRIRRIVERAADKTGQRFDETFLTRVATDEARGAIEPMAPCRFPPVGEGRGCRRRGELRIERQTDDLVRSPICNVARRFSAPRVPVAHRNETAMLRSEGSFQGPRLRFGVGEQWRAATQAPIDRSRNLRPPPGNHPRQRQAKRRRQANNCRIAEQIR